MVYRRNFLESFWKKVDVRGPDECWVWLAARYHDDYGLVGIRNQGRSTTMRAHALSLILATGEDANGRFALHRCDNPPCCNPAHLYWGDQKRNIADMDQRGRGRRPVHRGATHPRAKLTDDNVRYIRGRYATGAVSQQALADEFGVHQTIVSDIVRRVTWRHLKD